MKNTVKFGYVDDNQLINDAKTNCNTMLLGSVFTHLTIDDSIEILKKFDDFIVDGGEVIFSIVMSTKNKYECVHREGVYENSKCFVVTYFTDNELKKLTLNDRYKIEYVCKAFTFQDDIFRTNF